MLRQGLIALTARCSAALAPQLTTLPVAAAVPAIGRPLAAIGAAWSARMMTTATEAPPPTAPSERPRWWNLGEAATAEQAYHAFTQELRAKRIVRERALQEVAVRCSSPEDAALALKAARSLRRHRAARQMHEPFKGHTARVLLQAMLRSQAPLVAAAAVSERVSLGLPVSLKQVTKIVRALGAAGDWPALVTLARDIQGSGMATNSVINYVIARTAAETGHLKEGRRLMTVVDPDFARSPPCVTAWLSGVPPTDAAKEADAVAAAPADAVPEDVAQP